MNDAPVDDVSARTRDEAAAWFARMRGPEGPDHRAACDDWRAADPANEVAYARLLRRWDQSAFLANSALGRRRDLRRAARWSHAPALRYIAGAAAFAGLALAGLIALDRSRPRAEADTAAATIANQRHDIRTVRLADGSRVTLDTDSAIDLTFTATERRLRLDRGRVRIDAVADTARPFVVALPGGALVAGQSLFDVQTRQGLVEVALLRGALDIAPNASSGAVRRGLAVGQYVRLRPTGEIVPPRASTPGQLSWTRGMVSFDGDRLADAVAAINQRNDRQIVLGSPGIAELRITGAFHAHDPDGFAGAAAELFGLAIRQSPDGSIVLRKKT